MNYDLLNQVILLLERFERENKSRNYSILEFTKWLLDDKSEDLINIDHPYKRNEIIADSATSEQELIRSINYMVNRGWLEQQGLGVDQMNNIKLSEKAIEALLVCFSDSNSSRHAFPLTASEQKLLYKLLKIKINVI